MAQKNLTTVRCPVAEKCLFCKDT